MWLATGYNVHNVIADECIINQSIASHMNIIFINFLNFAINESDFHFCKT